MAPRTRTQSSGATSARSTRSGRRSGGSAADSAAMPASVSASASPMRPSATAPDPAASLDALYEPAAAAVNLVHMDRMAQYLQAAETQQSLDALLSVVKGTPPAGDEDDAADDPPPDYHTALDELDYLEGLFKKLRFSYKEQLTKETVVRRILELELPLLSAADIDRMVQDTEAERRRLRAVKAEGQAQRAAAERLVRDLAAERQRLAAAERDAATLPDRLLRLRHRLARLALALRAELAAMDGGGGAQEGKEGREASAAPPAQLCPACGRSFFSAAFYALHQALHGVQKNTDRSDEDDTIDFGDRAAQAAAVAATAMQRCRGCSQMVPAAFVARAAPPGETHTAFHARLQQATAGARSASALLRSSSVDGLDAGGLGADADGDVLQRLQRTEADLEALVQRVRGEAGRQAAIEGEMAQSLQHLRESVGSIRLEMARIEHEADRMAQHLEQGRTHMGRSLQEQTDLLDVLLGDGGSEDDDDDME